MQCNIDAKGKAVRLTGGIICSSIGVILGILVFTDVVPDNIYTCSAIGALLFSGAFMIFEARAGWCALRAMGIKTRI